MDLKELNVDELKELLGEIKESLVVKRAEDKANAKAEKAERAESFKNELAEGDRVSFLYGRENEVCEGIVVRASEKSATIESGAFEKGKNYVKYDRFVEVLDKAEVAEVAEVEEDEVLEEAI